MLGAMLVPHQPIAVDAQGDVRVAVDNTLDDRRCKENIGVTTDERFVHPVFGVQQRGEYVVVRPVAVMPKHELGIILLHGLDAISANEDDVVDIVLTKGVDRPIEQPPATDFREALWGISRCWHQPASASGSDDDGSHCVRLSRFRLNLLGASVSRCVPE